MKKCEFGDHYEKEDLVEFAHKLRGSTEIDKKRYEKLLAEYEKLNRWGTTEPLY